MGCCEVKNKKVELERVKEEIKDCIAAKQKIIKEIDKSKDEIQQFQMLQEGAKDKIKKLEGLLAHIEREIESQAGYIG